MLAGAGSEASAQGVRPIGAPVVLAHERPFRIGEAEFNPPTREVVFNGQRSVIEPRVMQLLIALWRAEGGVVSKDDLAILCWEGRIVGEDAINRVVSRLRAVAGKQAGGQFRVETITKVGYRLIGADNDAPSTNVPAQRLPRASRRDLIVGGSAAALAVAAGGTWLLTHRDPMPPEARRLYAESRAAFFQNTTEQTGNTIGKLRQAVAIAPDNADIWGLLGFAYVLLASKSPPLEGEGLYARGFSAAHRALALDPDQPDAQTAFIRATDQYRNWEIYERKCKQALRRHPKHDLLNIMMSDLMMQVGRLEEGLRYAETASRAVPDVPPLYWQRCTMLWNLGRLDEADALLSRAVALWPRNPAVWFTHVYYLMYNGHPAEAEAIIADTSRPVGVPDWNYEAIAMQAKSLAAGDSAAIRATIEHWNELATRGRVLAQTAAIYAGFVGDNDTAFRILDAYYFDRGFALPDARFARLRGARDRQTYFLFDQPLAALRRDPRFAALTRRIGLDEYWANTRSRSRTVA